MGKVYEKDGVLYEEGLFSDTKIGEIKENLTGDYVVDRRIGGNVSSVEKNPFTGEINITTDRDFFENRESGVKITPNPFSRHGQDSEDWSRPMWGKSQKNHRSSKNYKSTNNEKSFHSSSYSTATDNSSGLSISLPNIDMSKFFKSKWFRRGIIALWLFVVIDMAFHDLLWAIIRWLKSVYELKIQQLHIFILNQY